MAYSIRVLYPEGAPAYIRSVRRDSICTGGRMEELKRSILYLSFVVETDLLQLLLLDEANSNQMVPSIWYPLSLITY